jgi:hypothetical protein
MGQALSPRQPAPKLRSTVREQYGTPRRARSVFESVALSRGYTVKAGAVRRARLEVTKGVPTNNANGSTQNQA